MKIIKLLIIILSLPMISYGFYYEYAPYVYGAYEYENNLNDSSTYGATLNVLGNNPLFDNTVMKYGEYSVTDINATRKIVVPESIISKLAATSVGYSIQFWFYVNQDCGCNAGYNAFQSAFGREANGNANAKLDILITGWNDGIHGFFVLWGNNFYSAGATGYDGRSETLTWIFYSVEYDKIMNVVKIFKNGTLIYSSSPGSGNPFAEVGGTSYIGYSPAHNKYAYSANIDNFKFVNKLMNGIEEEASIGKWEQKYFPSGGIRYTGDVE